MPLRALLGYRILTEMAIPLAPAYVALALWLIVKGFDERRAAAQSRIPPAISSQSSSSSIR